jgi:hypothetical protein
MIVSAQAPKIIADIGKIVTESRNTGGTCCRRAVRPDDDGADRDDDGADRDDAGAERKWTAVSGRWRALTSNWREVTRYDPPFHLDVSVGFICKQAYAPKWKNIENGWKHFC